MLTLSVELQRGGEVNFDIGVGTHWGGQRDKGVAWGSGTVLAAGTSTLGAKPSHLEPNPTGMQKPTKAPTSSRHQAVKARKRLFPLKKKKKEAENLSGFCIVLCKILCLDCSLVHFNEALIAGEITQAYHRHVIPRAEGSGGCEGVPPPHQHSTCPELPMSLFFLVVDTSPLGSW